MDALRTTALAALADVLANQPDTPDKVAFAWQIVAGPAMGRSATAVWSPDGVLRVRAHTATWQREIRRAKPILVARLAGLLGPTVVRRLTVTPIEPRPAERGRPRRLQE